MWGAASMTMPMKHRNIDPYEKSIYFLVCSLAMEANLTEIQTNPFCMMNYHYQIDGPLGCNICETARIEIVHDMGHSVYQYGFNYFLSQEIQKDFFSQLT
jgi:hypothetical protein